MTLKEKINNDFMEAYKAKDMERKNFLGLIKGTIQTQEGKMVESTDENVLKVLKALEKGLVDTLEAKEKLGQDLTKVKKELSYLTPYLPVLMSEEEINSIVSELMTRNNVNKNQGFLMGLFNKEQKGKAFDNKTVSKIISEKLV
jgi:uncharacterized protein YqeY